MNSKREEGKRALFTELKSKTLGGLAQLARAPALQAGGHRFDSDILHKKAGFMFENLRIVSNIR